MEQKFSDKLIDNWVRFWNTFDLNQVENLFLKDDRVTYFSSEKVGLIKGYEELVKHHEGFGFVNGGKPQLSKLWLEEIDVEDFGDSAIVSAIWFFKRPNSENLQRGPVTIVYERTDNGWRIAHANFGNYK
jgi:ketosteroid isomerase-like protein